MGCTISRIRARTRTLYRVDYFLSLFCLIILRLHYFVLDTSDDLVELYDFVYVDFAVGVCPFS